MLKIEDFKCDECEGTGKHLATMKGTCWKCHGTGLDPLKCAELMSEEGIDIVLAGIELIRAFKAPPGLYLNAPRGKIFGYDAVFGWCIKINGEYEDFGSPLSAITALLNGDTK